MIPTARLLAVGDTEQEAEDIARAGAQWTVTSYANPTTGASRRSRRAAPRAGHRADRPPSTPWSAT